MAENNWNELEHILHDIYAKHDVSHSLSDDKKKLKEAYFFTENLWHRQFETFSNIRFVLLGEAPLFGDEKTYFYNENSKLTSFFRHTLKPEVSVFPSCEKKAALFAHLRDQGFIIVDLFPYALNDVTALNYKSLIKGEAYKSLLEMTYEAYLKPKLKILKGKSVANVRFCFRYRKQLLLKDYIGNKLREQTFPNFGNIGCVGSSNMPIDKNLLKEEYDKTCENL